MTNYKRIVVKVGSSILNQDNQIATTKMKNLVEFIAKIKNKNIEVILVSSGAVAFGYTKLQIDKKITSNKQVLASIGQPLLMTTYQKYFKSFDILCSQFLIEATVFDDDVRLKNAKDAISRSLKNSILPIINENDTTYTKELVFGDNDQLAGYVTKHFKADMLLVLSDIDGYYDKNPTTSHDAKLLKNIKKLDKTSLNDEHTPNSEFSTGGIVTKLKTASFLIKENIPMFLCSGFDLKDAKSYMFDSIHNKGTLFGK
ncbi:MAG: glutamate 5-kinase [Epsilonproteobacteria bacterium]|nr:MAG: glutamate 5-kinase [Campylobacterota bacterium]